MGYDVGGGGRCEIVIVFVSQIYKTYTRNTLCMSSVSGIPSMFLHIKTTYVTLSTTAGSTHIYTPNLYTFYHGQFFLYKTITRYIMRPYVNFLVHQTSLQNERYSLLMIPTRHCHYCSPPRQGQPVQKQPVSERRQLYRRRVRVQVSLYPWLQRKELRDPTAANQRHGEPVQKQPLPKRRRLHRRRVRIRVSVYSRSLGRQLRDQTTANS